MQGQCQQSTDLWRSSRFRPHRPNLRYRRHSSQVAVRQFLGQTARCSRCRLQQQKQEELQAIVQDQDRLRENMRTVTQNSDYYRRLLTKLNDQESRVETLQGEREKLHADAEAKRTALAEFLRTLTVE